MPIFVGMIIQFIARFIATRIVMWVAFKAFILLIFIVVVPLILNNFLYSIGDTFVTWILDNLPNDQINNLNGIVSLTGFAAWWLQLMKVPECVSVTLSAMSIRYALKQLPFVG